MKQVLQDRSGVTAVREVPPPPCPPGSLLVRTAFSVISTGTERARVELSKKSLLGKARERPDLVREVVRRARREGLRSTRDAVRHKLTEETAVGYSTAGVVLEVGEAVRGFLPGDRVACAGGGHASHSEIISVPSNLCARVPERLGLDVAAMTTIAAIALHGIRLADVRIGDRVAVIGCGLVGQIACRLLLAGGAEVFAIDVDPQRVQQARKYGARYGVTVGPTVAEEILAASSGIGMDEVVITAAASTNDPLVLATDVARDRGSVVLVGDVSIQAPRAAFYEKELCFRVSRSYGPGRYDLEFEERGLDYPIGYVRWTEQRNMEAILALQDRGVLELADLIDEVIPVEGAPAAYARLSGPVNQRPRGALVIAYADAPQNQPPPRAMTTSVPAHDDAIRRGVAGEVRIGLVGPGGFANRVLLPALAAADVHFEAVGGGTGPSAEAAGRRRTFRRVLESAEAVVADPDVDAVVIATRHESHAHLTATALRCGKHVFCEKPLALTEDELTDVLAVAADACGTLTVGFNRRYSPLLQKMREQVSVGERPLAATYRVSAGELPRDHWVHDLVQGGGRLLGEACHFVDALAFLAMSRIVSVYATAYASADVPLQARDNAVVTLTFANGSIGNIIYVSDGSFRVSKERIEVFCDARTAILDDFVELQVFGPTGTEKFRGKQDKGHASEISAFVAGVRAGIAPVPLDEIANVSAATLAIVESARTGQVVRIP